MSSELSTRISLPKVDRLSLLRVEFPTFKSANYRTWSHMARVFFVQHDLFGIVDGTDSNPAGEGILPKVHDGKVRLYDGTVLNGDPLPTWSDHQKDVWKWNRRHGLAYEFIMRSLFDDPAAYSKVIDCKTAHDVWETLLKEYSQSSNIILRVLESQLTGLFKKDDITMEDHINKYSQLIEQINYHLKPYEKWSNEKINRTFFGTISSDQWDHYEDGLGDSITNMLPSELYAKIKARDTAKRETLKRQMAVMDKEAK